MKPLPDFSRFPQIERAAWATWNDSPAIRFTHTDYGEFLQTALYAKGMSVPAVVKAWEARAIATPELNGKDGQRPKMAERIGSRLILRLVGPITPMFGLAPAIELEDVARALDEHRDAGAIVLRIDSGGGNSWAGECIANLLLSDARRKLAIIDGSCYSAATWIAAAADRVLIRANGTMLLHRHTAELLGNSEQLFDAARYLKQRDSAYARFIATRRHGITQNRVEQLVARETYLTAMDTIAEGLAHGVIESHPLRAASLAHAGGPVGIAALHALETGTSTIEGCGVESYAPSAL